MNWCLRLKDNNRFLAAIENAINARLAADGKRTRVQISSVERAEYGSYYAAGQTLSGLWVIVPLVCQEEDKPRVVALSVLKRRKGLWKACSWNADSGHAVGALLEVDYWGPTAGPFVSFLAKDVLLKGNKILSHEEVAQVLRAASQVIRSAQTDAWNSLRDEIDIHGQMNDNRLTVDLHPVVDGVTAVNYSLTLISGVRLAFSPLRGEKAAGEESIPVDPSLIRAALRQAAAAVEAGQTDAWYGLNEEVDLHILLDETSGLTVELYPVVNGATVVDYCLPLITGVQLAFVQR